MATFKNILIPVDSLYNAQIAAEKALELADSADTTLFLVATIRFDSLSQKLLYTSIPFQKKTYLERKEAFILKKLEALKERIHRISSLTKTETMIITETTISDNLLLYAQDKNIDLVIATKEKYRQGFSFFRKDIAEDLARKANLAVLTVTKGCLNHPIKTIVLPVTSFVPERKIEMALAFARQFNAHIHLITMLDNNDISTKIRIDAFYLTYKILAESGHSPQYKILHGSDSDSALVRYANQVKADMILVNPEKKKILPVFFHGKITDMIQPFSALHILTLKPYLRRSI
ncbi:universal stress protein [Sediminibacterium goheungense]|uniref:Nucleotide-binding universal stress UspA family protein n=1 Tax=Sediminibacterium goheungense TaxID=1086393 RepID=A0A4R6IYP2_9BACT|nr:universal stress protein [Sediminibacterium goheungense]TDO27969.1 nucleotide-binding universal stress UspA family protein [Sediminibacterium goheungense]